MLSREEYIYIIDRKLKDLSTECLKEIWYLILKDEGMDYISFRNQIQKDKNKQLNLLEYKIYEKTDLKDVIKIYQELGQNVIANSKDYDLSDKDQKKEYYRALKKAEKKIKRYIVIKSVNNVKMISELPDIKGFELNDWWFHSNIYNLSEPGPRKAYYETIKKDEQKKYYRLCKHDDAVSIDYGPPKLRRSKSFGKIRIRVPIDDPTMSPEIIVEIPGRKEIKLA
jgi:hypothetical protein